jgi:2-polyprenyl-6-methoxyphenol hydroxylase-like FAD-dependent oxidoreductase
VLIAPWAGSARGLGLLAQEGGKWLLTVAGYAGDHPPATREDMIAFAASIAPADFTAAVRQAQATGEVATFRFRANTRRLYERMRDRPAGLVPLGDAICAFNPVYGQGMSVAARQAAALRAALATGPDGLEARYLRAAGRIASDAWKLTAAADLAQPAVPGPRPRATRLTNAYLRRLHAAAAHDPRVAHAFVRVSGMLDRPQALLRPAVARRVLFPPPRNRAHPGATLAPPAAQT